MPLKFETKKEHLPLIAALLRGIVGLVVSAVGCACGLMIMIAMTRDNRLELAAGWCLLYFLGLVLAHRVAPRHALDLIAFFGGIVLCVVVYVL